MSVLQLHQYKINLLFAHIFERPRGWGGGGTGLNFCTDSSFLYTWMYFFNVFEKERKKKKHVSHYGWFYNAVKMWFEWQKTNSCSFHYCYNLEMLNTVKLVFSSLSRVRGNMTCEGSRVSQVTMKMNVWDNKLLPCKSSWLFNRDDR